MRSHQSLSSLFVRAAAAGAITCSVLGAYAWLAGEPASAATTTLYAAPSAVGSGNCQDSSDACTLATALSDSAAGDTIELAAGTYEQSGGWSISKAVTLLGIAGGSVLDGQGESTVLYSNPTSSGTVTLQNLTITNGNGTRGPASQPVNGGGAYVASGSLSVSNCQFSEDVASGEGGAIDNGDGIDFPVGTVSGGTVTVTGSSFTADSAVDGGAIDNGDFGGSGTVVVTGSTFAGDSAGADGGAIDNGDDLGSGLLSIGNSTFSGDSAASGDGGAIDNGDSSGSGSVTVTGSTFSGDSAADSNPSFGDGGAIDNGDGATRGSEAIAVSASTFSSDTATGDGGAIDTGDYANVGVATVDNSTFFENSSNKDGGAIDNADNAGTGTLAVSSSTFDANSAKAAAAVGNSGKGAAGLAGDILAGGAGGGTECAGIIGDHGYNISDDSSCGLSATNGSVSSSSVIADYLGTLGNYGGATETVPLLATPSPVTASPDPAYEVVPSSVDSLTINSGAISQTGPAICSLPDERGYPREPSYCDIGAFDLGWSTTSISSSSDSPVAGQSVTYTASVTTAEPEGITGGSVTFSIGSSPASCENQDDTFDVTTGTALCEVTWPAAGSYDFTAAWSGDSEEQGSSQTLPVTVSKTPTSTGLEVETSSPVAGQAITFSYSVIPPGGDTLVPSGTVTVSGGGQSCAGGLSGGSGSCQITEASPGTYDFTAAYSGGSAFSSSSSSPASVGVTKAATSLEELSSSPEPSAPGKEADLRAIVSVVAPGAGQPTGTVAFSEGTRNLCTARLASPLASCTAHLPVAASQRITATYSGDADLAPSSASLIHHVQVGYYTVTSNGIVTAHGNARYYGSLPRQSVAVGIAASSNGKGYFVAEASGKVLTFGDARRLKPIRGERVEGPIDGVMASSAGGYYLFGPGGTVFCFGTARFYGSLGHRKLAAHVVAMAVTPDSKGYFLVESNGAITAFGDAKYEGRIRASAAAPVVGIVATSDEGYLVVRSDGSVSHFGTASYFGSVKASSRVVGFEETADQGGYFIAEANSRVVGKGDATVGRITRPKGAIVGFAEM